MQKPALGIPIIIVTIVLFMFGYVQFMTNGTKQPEAPPGPPVANMQAPAATPVEEPSKGDSSGLSQPGMPADEEVKTWIGRFAGCIDNSLVVIYVGDEARTFHTPPGFTGVDLVKGDNVSFDFSYNQHGQPVLSTIKKLVPTQ